MGEKKKMVEEKKNIFIGIFFFFSFFFQLIKRNLRSWYFIFVSSSTSLFARWMRRRTLRNIIFQLFILSVSFLLLFFLLIFLSNTRENKSKTLTIWMIYVYYPDTASRRRTADALNFHASIKSTTNLFITHEWSKIFHPHFMDTSTGHIKITSLQF